LCDSTLLVLRAEESSRALTQQARDALWVVGAKIAGVVINDVSRRGGRYSYYGGYGSYYSREGSNGHKKKAAGGVATAGAPGDVAASGKKDESREPELRESPAGSETYPEKVTSPVEIREYHSSKPAGQEAVADVSGPPEAGVVTAQKKNGRKTEAN
jgi:hypothetical protein